MQQVPGDCLICEAFPIAQAGGLAVTRRDACSLALLGPLLLLLLLFLVFLPLLLVSQTLDELVGEEADQCKCNYRGQNEDPIVEAVLNGPVRSSSG